ncbi:MAG: sigma factor-like helix-turn-helix DNA-binding protein [Candidatus Hodarchaeales archaeon]
MTDEVRRRILALKGLPYAEIAQKVGIPEGTVKRAFHEERQAELDRKGTHVVKLEIPNSISSEEAMDIILSARPQEALPKKGTHFVTLQIPKLISQDEALKRILSPKPKQDEMTRKGSYYVTLEIPETISEQEALQRVLIPELKFDYDLLAIREAQTGRTPLDIRF